MARGWPGAGPGIRLEESLYRLKGIAAATGCIGVAVEMQSDGCPHLHSALQTLAMVALDEVEAVQKAEGEVREELRTAKGIPEPGKRKEQAGTD